MPNLPIPKTEAYASHPPQADDRGTQVENLAMGMVDFLDEQKREALGPVNKWYCSQHYRYEVNDPDVLLAYYIKHGGAWHFRQMHRFEPENQPQTNACRA